MTGTIRYTANPYLFRSQDAHADGRALQDAVYLLMDGRADPPDWKPLLDIVARLAAASGAGSRAFLGQAADAIFRANGSEHDPIVATLDRMLDGGNG